jgi:SAM-dependent methyltransferase
VTDRATWKARHAEPGTPRAPSPWAIDRCRALPAGSTLLDLAAGKGRHARPLARFGLVVVALDFVERAVAEAVRGEDASAAVPLGIVADTAALPLRDGSLDAVLCVNYLERDVFPALRRVLRPGGRLIVETFSRRHLELVRDGRAKGPRSAAVMLEPGELPRLVAPLHVVEHEELHVHDEVCERYVARVVAVKTE